MRRLSLLLPERRRLAGQALSPEVGRALARADHEVAAAGDESAQLRRYFKLSQSAWPLAAMTRQLDVGDAGDALWLRADPVRVQPDMTGVRLLAYGDLGLGADHAAQLAELLQPVFAEHGWQLSAPHPQRWYLRLPADLHLPHFAPPERVLGDDLFEHLPDGADARRWRALLNDTQVLLHQQAEAGGTRAANSLWFWGAGRLPERIEGRIDALESDEADLRALAMLAEAGEGSDGHRLIDLRDARDWSRVEAQSLLSALRELRRGELGELTLDFADGCLLRVRASQRWRFWRKPLATLA
ncbi:MAG TPA: phosphoglycerate mutase [Arenimonas sp.]|nr:phosphoglycerate mutase [Arenimonas sp.]